MIDQIEEWKQIKGYENLYMVSNTGKIKSLVKIVRTRVRKERILSPTTVKGGYRQVTLFKNEIRKSILVHHLVYDNFGKDIRNSRIIQVDHIDDNPSNNNINNLQLLTCRLNILKKKKQHSSKYKGVFYSKQNKKWASAIRINGKSKFLGYFIDEEIAGEKYKQELKLIENENPTL